MLWLIPIILLLLALYICFEVRVERSSPELREKRIAKYIAVRALFVFLTFPICISVFNSLMQKNKWEQFKEDILSAVVAKKMDRNDLNSIIRMKHKEVFQSSEKDAKKWAKEFLDSLDERRREIDDIKEMTKELSDKLYLKWKPLCDFVLREFDERILEFQRRGKKIDFERKVDEFDLVIDADSTKYTERYIRSVMFPNGCKAAINFGPGQIQRGVFYKMSAMNFYEVSKMGSTCVFSIWFFDDRIHINSNLKRYINVQHTTHKDPLSDDQFRDKINEAVNQLIASVYLMK